MPIPARDLVLECARKKQITPEFSKVLANPDVDLSASDKDGNTGLHIASEQGYEAMVQLFLERANVYLAKRKQYHVDVNQPNKKGNTALHLACTKKQEKVVALLLQQEHTDTERTNEDGDTPLHAACKQNHVNIVNLLLHKNNKPIFSVNNEGDTLFHIACKNDCIQIVKMLLSNLDISHMPSFMSYVNTLIRIATANKGANKTAIIKLLEQRAEDWNLLYATLPSNLPAKKPTTPVADVAEMSPPATHEAPLASSSSAGVNHSPTAPAHAQPRGPTAPASTSEPSNVDISSEQRSTFASQGFPGFSYEAIREDGNCLFSAIASQLKRINYSDHHTHQSLRELAVCYMEQHIDEYIALVGHDNLFNEGILEYFPRMKKDGEYAGDVEIKALAAALKIRIQVMQPGMKPRIYSNGQDDHLPIIYLAYIGLFGGLAGHYDALIPPESLSTPLKLQGTEQQVFDNFTIIQSKLLKEPRPDHKALQTNKQLPKYLFDKTSEWGSLNNLLFDDYLEYVRTLIGGLLLIHRGQTQFSTTDCFQKGPSIHAYTEYGTFLEFDARNYTLNEIHHIAGCLQILASRQMGYHTPYETIYINRRLGILTATQAQDAELSLSRMVEEGKITRDHPKLNPNKMFRIGVTKEGNTIHHCIFIPKKFCYAFLRTLYANIQNPGNTGSLITMSYTIFVHASKGHNNIKETFSLDRPDSPSPDAHPNPY